MLLQEGAEQTTQNPFSAPKPSAGQDVIHLCLKAEEDALTPRSFLLFTTVRGKPIHGLVRENRKARRERSRWEKKEARPIARSIITGVSYPPHPSPPKRRRKGNPSWKRLCHRYFLHNSHFLFLFKIIF